MSARSCVGFLGVACVVLSGCLQAERFSVIRYDQQRDTYHHLRVFYNVRSGGKNEASRDRDYKWLAEIWEQRESLLLVSPVSLRILGDSEDQWLQTARHEYRTVNLGESGGATVGTTEADLDAFRTRPGRFFISHEEALCYYHQTEIPGAAIDLLLKQKQGELRREIQAAAAEEQTRRLNGNAERLSWDYVRRGLRAMIREEEWEEEPPALPPISLFDDESLRRLIRDAERGDMSLARNQGTLTLKFTLSPRDADELLKTIRQVQTDIRATSTRMVQLEPWAKKLARLLQAQQNQGKVTLSFDALELFNGDAVQQAAFNAQQIERSMDAVEEARRRNLPIDTNLTMESILDEFLQGTLK